MSAEACARRSSATEARGEWTLRQGNQFFYLSGVVEPRAMLIVDGRTKRTTLFLNAAAPRVRQYGPYLTATDSARRVTGVDVVMPRDSFAVMLAALDGRVIYTPLRPETQSSESAGDVAGYFRRSKADPWDGRVSREELFVAAVKRTVPAAVTCCSRMSESSRPASCFQTTVKYVVPWAGSPPTSGSLQSWL